MSKKLKLGLFGLGSVGQGFYELLDQSKSPNLEIKKIVIKNPTKTRTIESSIFSTTPTDILDDLEIDIVVELIDDAAVALEILKQSLQRRKPVVTANKKMLAENLEEIFWLQKKYNTPVLYEGAVCGSIPIIRNLEMHYAYDALESFEGIFNGSTNYILTKMIDEKMSYEGALGQAQKLGFAESDPTLDVKGYDARYKLAISIAHAFGCFVKPSNILGIGIDKLSAYDIRFAKQQGCTIKLIAKAQKIGNKVFGIVAPTLIPLENPLANIKNEFNGLTLIGASTGLQMLTGKGAGSLPTGLVVLSDVASLASGFKYPYPKTTDDNSVAFEKDALINVYISSITSGVIRITDFEEFTGGYQGQGAHFMKGWISIKKLLEWIDRKDLSVLLTGDSYFRVYEPKKAHEFSLA
ncbi:MAG: homoserine dehydrogenase [Cyclobacteriaceae bacterium]|nr:homoserine dehydrogenase [Cyclobacteriaceae bacterium]